MWSSKGITLFLLLCAPLAGGGGISHYLAEDEEAAFMLYDVQKEQCLIEYNPQLCQTPLSPCSTFKIANALIGLDLGILRDEHSAYAWDGTKQYLPCWEKDHTLGSALQGSVVWFFQRLAREVGEDNYHDYLEKFDYGNMDISSGVSDFWLGKSLLITPYQQMQFLLKLCHNSLPVSHHALNVVKRSMRLETTAHWELCGKTGSDPSTHQGWFIGWLDTDTQKLLFVTYMRGGEASGVRAKRVTKQILQDLLQAE